MVFEDVDAVDTDDPEELMEDVEVIEDVDEDKLSSWCGIGCGVEVGCGVSCEEEVGMGWRGVLDCGRFVGRSPPFA